METFAGLPVPGTLPFLNVPLETGKVQRPLSKEGRKFQIVTACISLLGLLGGRLKRDDEYCEEQYSAE